MEMQAKIYLNVMNATCIHLCHVQGIIDVHT